MRRPAVALAANVDRLSLPWHHRTVVTVTGTLGGTAGRTAVSAPSWLEQRAVPYLVAGWLVDDIAVTVLAPTPPTA